MNTFDIILLAAACLLVVVGMVKGLVRILIGIAALVAAFGLAATYHQPLASRWTKVDLSSDVLSLIAYVLIFIGVMLTGGLIAFVLRKVLKAAMLSWADRLGGAALGLAAATLAAGLLILPLVAYSPASERMLSGSVLAPYVSVVADMANQVAPEEMSDRYREQIGELRQFWNERIQGSRPQA